MAISDLENQIGGYADKLAQYNKEKEAAMVPAVGTVYAPEAVTDISIKNYLGSNVDSVNKDIRDILSWYGVATWKELKEKQLANRSNKTAFNEIQNNLNKIDKIINTLPSANTYRIAMQKSDYSTASPEFLTILNTEARTALEKKAIANANNLNALSKEQVEKTKESKKTAAETQYAEQVAVAQTDFQKAQAEREKEMENKRTNLMTQKMYNTMPSYSSVSTDVEKTPEQIQAEKEKNENISKAMFNPFHAWGQKQTKTKLGSMQSLLNKQSAINKI